MSDALKSTEESLDKNIAKYEAKLAAISKKDPNMPEWWSAENAMTMSASILLFGAIIIFLVAFLIKNGRNSESVLRVFGTILIIISTLFLIVAGYSDIQIAPAMGLLGTIAGYLLGKQVKND
jgi:hypothetical protein